MKYLLALVVVLALALSASAAEDITYCWTLPTTHTDGTPVADGEIFRVNVYCGPYDAAGLPLPFDTLASLPTTIGQPPATCYRFIADVPLHCDATFVTGDSHRTKEHVPVPLDPPSLLPDLDVSTVRVSRPKLLAPLKCKGAKTCKIVPPTALPRETVPKVVPRQ